MSQSRRRKSEAVTEPAERWYGGADVPMSVIQNYARQIVDRFQPEGTFPGLAADGYVAASPKTHAYNCVAWAAEDASRWWEPGISWPGPLGDDLASLAGLFATLGYSPCAGDELEAGHEKIALYGDDQGEWTHAARQLPDGWWTSKLGPDEDILHRTP